jgi:hypothetical protein
MFTTVSKQLSRACPEHARSNALSMDEHSAEHAGSDAPNPLLLLILIQRIMHVQISQDD